MIIGDGYISTTGELKIGHKTAHCEYVLWKQKLLQDIGVDTRLYNIISNKKYPQTYIISNREFKNERELIYYHGKKHLSQHMVDTLFHSPLMLAIWYMDDGSLVKHRNPLTKSIKARCVYFSTESFTLQENERLIDGFKNIGIIAKIANSKNGNYHIWMNTLNSAKFISMIGEYVKQVKCMQYKIDFEYKCGKPNPIVLDDR